MLPSVQWVASDLVRSDSELLPSHPKVAPDLPVGMDTWVSLDSQLPPVPLGKQDGMEVQKALESDTLSQILAPSLLAL